ncbi:MAG: carboxypeptidase M32 [Candidatus Vogelbacteria bacterium CG10_big_fil_rev_8_21_14_0_10_49_38]|uniref:Metal-dependent carboxypeptidase n=1 Tax=Candidatus Vogelbacteria bacterium CG10_big_fil_rev_8_21_14_0_10_49_38 TaxID=1975043 RepID=A0A2H0RH57_9BACT|nr:MAG: hypothetical protein BK006_02580 [bacterium CG10_49_38]PIR45892.1 MAG: carboxypeptidase M32 [Candidatus Vogelbacteria bacterium CG10_big_fil_rev_8_21_14_0_10_49_38]
MAQAAIDQLKERLRESAYLDSTINLLTWDQEVNLPPQAAKSRAETIAHVSALAHRQFIAINSDGLLTELKQALDANQLKGAEATMVAEIHRHYERARKLPEDHVRELAATASQGASVWVTARAENDFALWLPWLEKIVALKRREAEYVGYAGEPYDALLDFYEPGTTTATADKLLTELKNFLVPFLQTIKRCSIKLDAGRLRGRFPLDQQIAFNRRLAAEIGFDFGAGRLDESAHPFSTNLHPLDVRMTTRYKTDDVLYAIGSTIHETGHSLYEQNLPVEHFGTPLAESVSLGIHESQSRLWENNLGKSLPFWRHFYPELQAAFPDPFGQLALTEFYRLINRVEPSFIRTEADEVTYNLHIILRFELEQDLIAGRLEPRDLPNTWNAKMKEYLGLAVPDDKVGVLQDAHWAGGEIGYFATYSLGNFYAAQMHHQMKKDLPDLDRRLTEGDFRSINDWLKHQIHRHGKTYPARQLIKQISGEELSARFFTNYLKEKYGAIYEI